MRIVFPGRKALLWGLALTAAVLAAGLWSAFAYLTDSKTLAGLIRAEAPRYLPGARLDIGRVRVRWPFGGQIHVQQVAVHQKIDGVAVTSLRIPWLLIRHDARAMLKGRFIPREVVVTHPTLRLCRRKDGTWNLQGLLADPWPAPPLETSPTISVQNGTIELCDEDPRKPCVAILRDVSLRVAQGEARTLRFEGTAKGDSFDRLSLQGTVDLAGGRVVLGGDLARLEITKTLRSRLPAEYRPEFDRLGLASGELDLRLDRLVFEPSASPRLRYDASARLRSGLWDCRPALPFPINDLTASLSARDGEVAIERAEGYNGTTTVRATGRFRLGDPNRAPLDMRLDVVDLEFDKRLKDWTPPDLAPLWGEYQPKGRIDAAIHAVREVEGGPVGLGMTVTCRDVAIVFHEFPYPVGQIKGHLVWEGGKIRVDVHTSVNGKPLTARGTIDNPGPRPHVRLTFGAQSLPIDETLLDALPDEVSKVVREFHPSGTVRGVAHAEWVPPKDPREHPSKGKLSIDADIDLNEGFAIKWDGMPYPVSNLTGRLTVHPDQWIIRDMRGMNGQAVITANGKVEADAQKRLSVDLAVTAKDLLFDTHLQAALPPAWKKTWATINPVGSSDVDALIKIRPGQPDSYHMVVLPKEKTGVLLKVDRAAKPAPGAPPPPPYELRMEDVSGRFVSDNGTVEMQDVGFLFRGSKVSFARGRVQVKDSGEFKLGVEEVQAKEMRVDAGIRKIMSPVLAQFCRRLDDGNPFTLKGNLALGWSGDPGQPAWCTWDHTIVIFNNNSIQADMPLKAMQGELANVSGFFNGERFELHGAVDLASVHLLGQQITNLESPLDIKDGIAELGNIRGGLLGGTVSGRVRISLNETPEYSATLEVQGADLERYAKTLDGRQSFKGQLHGKLELGGLGNDLRTLQGRGNAHITQGDLGTLPIYLQFVNILKLPSATKTAFDSADVTIAIHNGDSYLDPIKFTGNAFSLQGRGTLGVQGNLDLRLRVLYGRDRLHIPVFSDALREASGQFIVVRVQGTPANPKPKLEPLPQISDTLRSMGSRRGGRDNPERR